MNNIIAVGTMPDGYAGDRANVVWVYIPETKETETVCRFGSFGSGLPKTESKQAAAILLTCLAPDTYTIS